MAFSYKKIISLVPSLTELLVDLGLEDQLAGRTRFCVHPKQKIANIPIMGGTKNPRIDKIQYAKPDLIIANKEENRKEDIEALRQNFEVMVTEIATIEEALAAIHRIGLKLDVEKKAQQIVAEVKEQLAQRPQLSSLKTAYFIWKEPWMTVGGDTYIHDVMLHWNLENVFADAVRYPVIMLDELAEFNSDLILLSSEPYPFKEKHLPIVKEACPEARVLLVEGEWFSWYGSRMITAFERLNVWRRAIA